MEKLHPGAKWLFRIRGYFGFFIPLLVIVWFLGSILFSLGSSMIFLIVLIIFIIIYIALVLIFGEIYARMAYNRWFYEFTNNSLKLERGIIWKHYSNVPYERVQNVDIHRGILARILGFSTLDIQTAGYHMSYSRRGRPRSEGSLPAIKPEKAEKLRDFLMKKISGKGKNKGM